MNASRARLFAYLFINLQTVRTRNPFGRIQPGARPSAHDRSGPRSLWSSAFVVTTLLLDHFGTRVLWWLVCSSGGLPPRRKPTLLRDLRSFVFFPLCSRLQPQHPRPILDPAQQPTPCRFGACPRSATLVHDFSSARPRPVLVIWRMVNMMLALHSALCINAGAWSEPAPRCFRAWPV